MELNVAVLHSFTEDGVTITDHHTEARRFMTHLEREERSGRVCPVTTSEPNAPASLEAHQRRPSAGADTTATLATPPSWSAISVAHTGRPRT